MNGRVYDYNLGRFLSVDPFIQSPGNSQSMNPYSYIMNNPLAGTDPTGYQSETKVKEITLKVKVNISKPGSRIKSHTTKVSAKITENSDGSFSIELSSSNGAAVDAAASATSNALAAPGDFEGLASTNSGSGDVSSGVPNPKDINFKPFKVRKFTKPKKAEIKKEIRGIVSDYVNTNLGDVSDVVDKLDILLWGFSEELKIEIGANIKKIGDGYGFDSPVTSFEESTINNMPDSSGYKAWWHTHPAAETSELSSTGDIARSMSTFTDAYASSKFGITKFNYSAYKNELNVRYTKAPGILKSGVNIQDVINFESGVISNFGVPYITVRKR